LLFSALLFSALLCSALLFSSLLFSITSFHHINHFISACSFILKINPYFSFHLTSYHIISYHIISYHIISYHIRFTSQNIFFFLRSFNSDMLLSTRDPTHIFHLLNARNRYFLPSTLYPRPSAICHLPSALCPLLSALRISTLSTLTTKSKFSSEFARALQVRIVSLHGSWHLVRHTVIPGSISILILISISISISNFKFNFKCQKSEIRNQK
jgi:hypothetical protein